MELIDKAALVAEIEKRIEETKGMQPKFDQFWAGNISVFKGVLKILDTLEVKEVDLKLNKLYKQGWKDAVAKASIFVYQLATAFPDTSYTDADNMTDGFKKYMEEQQQQKTFEQEDMDEKIRQYLLWLVNPLWEDTINNVGLKKDDIIAWIEKHG